VVPRHAKTLMRRRGPHTDLATWSRRSLAVALLAAALAGTAPAAELAPGVRPHLAAATFEVVQLKPEPDPLSYEKPLPLELLPYRERTDKYRSMGTAFAIGHDRFVSAGHVISAGAGSQYGPPALRDAAGKIYPIDTIIKFSSVEDYAVFTVHGPPAVAPLETRSRPPLNEPVFAVGNALGEGVVIRDGLYTSETPEELEGRWKWLRFSAAASPGNSGGPLVDRAGRVIGVVLRKSQNENLNFAVAIGQVLHGSEDFGVFEGRSVYRLPIMRAADSIATHEQVPLPKPVSEFYAATLAMLSESLAKQQAAFLFRHAERIFPRGAGAQQLLHSLVIAHFPRLITEGDSGNWGVPEPQTRKAQLSANGQLEFGADKGDALARLRVPDDLSVAALFEDSKLFMELLLRGTPLSRTVGSDAVRVTSMGKAQLEYWHTDGYGRLWQMRTWNLPFNDAVVITLALPTPDGCVLFIAQSPSQMQELVRSELKFLADFIYVSLSGKLRQWREFLAHPALLPKAVRDLDIQFDYARGFALRSSRFKMLVPVALQKLEPDSRLLLKFSFLPDRDRASWELAGVYLADSDQAGHWVDVLRHPRPASGLPEEFANRWRTMTTLSHPYTATAYTVSGSTRIETVANAKEVNAGNSGAAYTLTVTAAGEQAQRVMKAAIDTLQRGLTITEP
jgi:serine protease Do